MIFWRFEIFGRVWFCFVDLWNLRRKKGKGINIYVYVIRGIRVLNICIDR